jgi:dihydropteridine reductase
MKKCVVVGGAGTVGRQLVKTLISRGATVINVDRNENVEATTNILLSSPSLEHLETASGKAKSHGPLDAVFCVAGGWQGGNITSTNFLSSTVDMWQMNGVGAILAASIASSLSSDGILVLTSAKASLGPTPGMIGYGMAKAATNHLISSLAADGSGFKGTVVGILPVTIDTPVNRQAMPNADHSAWTPIEALVEKMVGWMDTPPTRNGQLFTVTTEKNNTRFEAA